MDFSKALIRRAQELFRRRFGKDLTEREACSALEGLSRPFLVLIEDGTLLGEQAEDQECGRDDGKTA